MGFITMKTKEKTRDFFVGHGCCCCIFSVLQEARRQQKKKTEKKCKNVYKKNRFHKNIYSRDKNK